MNYRKINNITGWSVGIFATIIYLMTMEPTTSFWDCGEFLSVAYRLEVGHSPGAPFFMLLGRMFSLFAFSNESIATAINSLSAVASGMTILFLFWSITHFARRLFKKDENSIAGKDMILVMGAGLVGALAYTFSDTFWFSAVEGEVYATSSFLTAFVFWAMLKWEENADQPHADRWILLIAYILGISVGVHLLNLLAIPAIGIIYYFKKYKVTTLGSIIAFVISVIILGVIQIGVIQGIPTIASKFELLFVNNFNLPYDVGAIFFLLLLGAGLVALLIYAKKKGFYSLHLATLSLMFVLIGFSSYLAPIIRSRADVPIDMTDPDNVMSFLPYVQREQFGSQPLLYGSDFDAQAIRMDKTGNKYAKALSGKDHYDIVGTKGDIVYEANKQRFFPRIWDSNDPNHVNFYKQYLGLSENERPTSADNLSFFMGYQINWMWWRYFMWNYAGRQNDLEGQGDAQKGNWISGIKFLDKMRVGDFDKMSIGHRQNRAHNEFYFLPLILGLMGMVFQFNRNKRDGIVTLMLFFFTGIAIAIYLNMPPLQPRERDYAFVGSMYAFAIWIGLGVLMVHDLLKKALRGGVGVYASIVLCLLLVPTLMAKEGWDDHDRSNKTLARATAINTLSSCAPNAVLFTFADNDTYPLWYIQEIEKFRTDVRVINLSLLGIDWYIDQLTYKVNDAEAVPMIWKRSDYRGDRLNYLRYSENPAIPKDRYFSLEEICNFMASSDPKNMTGAYGQMSNYLPVKNVFLPGLPGVADSNGSNIMQFTINKDLVTKSDISVMNIMAAIAKEGWKRPVYFCGGLSGIDFLGMEDYAHLQGLTYRILPTKGPFATDSLGREVPTGIGSVDLEKSTDLFLNTYTYGGAEKDNVYFDEKNRNMFVAYRLNSARIANELVLNNEKEKAIKVLDKVMKGISERSYRYDATVLEIANSYYHAGANQKGKALAMKLAKNYEDDINWVIDLGEERAKGVADEIQRGFSIINSLAQTAQQYGDSTTAKDLNARNEKIYKNVMSNLGGLFSGQAQGR